MKLQIDPERPNRRLIGQVVDVLRSGGVVVYPTDSVYGLGADMGDKKAIERIYRIKGKREQEALTFICNDIKDISRYAILTDHAYRLIRRLLPGPYTIIVRASREVPRIMTKVSPTLGVRIPDHPVPRAIVEQLGHPLVSSSVPTPEGVDYNDPLEIEKRLGNQVELVIDSGLIFPEPSTILDLTEDVPRLLRQGKGSIDDIGRVEIVEDDEARG